MRHAYVSETSLEVGIAAISQLQDGYQLVTETGELGKAKQDVISLGNTYAFEISLEFFMTVTLNATGEPTQFGDYLGLCLLQR